MMDDIPPIGDNNPPPDLLTGERLKDKLHDDHHKLLDRRDELLQAFDRLPSDISDDEWDRKATDFARQLQTLASVTEKTRVGVKEPYLEGQRGVDGFFKSISDPILKSKKEVERRLTKYKLDKEARERRAREDALRIAREEEDRKRREAAEAAAKIKTEDDLAHAVMLEKQAQQAVADTSRAEKDATAKAADLSRARGEYGGVSSLRTRWTFDSLDRATIDLEKLRQHIPIVALEVALNSFIKAGGREIAGAHIFEVMETLVR